MALIDGTVSQLVGDKVVTRTIPNTREQLTPDIGVVVEVKRGPTWPGVLDHVACIRVCHGQKPNRRPCEDDELSVLVWGSNKERYKPGVYEWREVVVNG